VIRWRRLGFVYSPPGNVTWARTHAYCPTPLLSIDTYSIRVFCAFLDGDRIGRCGWVDVDAQDPRIILDVSVAPSLDVGREGTFDEHGVTPLSVVRLSSGDIRLYYAGWQRGVGVRYSLFTGAAESSDGGTTFARISEAPLLDRSDDELHTRTGGLVLHDGRTWHMWYAGGSGWAADGATARPRYSLRYLRSDDGVNWPRHGVVCLEPHPHELGFGRPCILRRGGTLHMWYGRRSLSGEYRLGYATSHDGLDWARDDRHAGLRLAATGKWDSEMIGLSSLLESPFGTYLFYNGNGYGATGFGVAVATEQ
jgi:hypothetical protein